MFLLQAGMGLDGAIAGAVNPFLKRYFGIVAFCISAIPLLFRAPTLMSFQWPAGRIDNLHQVFVSNGAYLGASMAPNRSANPTDGWLNLTALPWKGKWYRLGQFLNALTAFHQSHRPRSSTVFARFQKASLVTSGPILGQRDGEVFTLDSPTVTIRPRALQVLR